MKKPITLFILATAMLSCTQQQDQTNDQLDPPIAKLDGYWILASSQYKGEKTSDQLGCPIPDARVEDLYQPRALGPHLLIKDDKVSVFRYPYAYYGTFNYKIVDDSLVLESGYTSTSKFFIHNRNNDTVALRFEEELTSTCLLSSEAMYTRFSPNQEVINKLMQDSISCDSLVGKWWYLRKAIHYEDGMDPTILNFPKGMPDSIFVSQEMINQDARKPFIELELDDRIVKMLFKYPYDDEFILAPEIESDRLLFSGFHGYEEYKDTSYYDVVYYHY